jgi:hypothetical protein
MKETAIKILCCVCLVLLFGCKSKPVIITQNRDSIVFREKIDTMRIKERDSVVIRQDNDTIYIEKYKTLFKDHTSIKHDTITKYIDRVIKSPETRENKGRFKDYAIIAGGTIIAMLLMIVGGFMIFRR